MTIGKNPDPEMNTPPQNIHLDQPDGFPGGEGEDPCVCLEPPGLVNPDPDCKTHRVDDRDRLNTRYAAIREAAQQIVDYVEVMEMTGEFVQWTIPEAEQAYEDIKYKLLWVAKTGQGMEDIT